jgi:DNA-binding Lrp family transcriptional regulator
MGNKYAKNDIKILCELIESSSITIRELGNKLNIHPNTVLKRIKKLERDEVIIKNHSEIDFNKLGYDLRALIHIKVRMGDDWETEIKELIKIPQILSFYAVTGISDFVAMVVTRDKKELEEVLRKFQKNKVIIDTTTHLMISCYKHPYEYNPFKIENLNSLVDD